MEFLNEQHRYVKFFDDIVVMEYLYYVERIIYNRLNGHRNLGSNENRYQLIERIFCVLETKLSFTLKQVNLKIKIDNQILIITNYLY